MNDERAVTGSLVGLLRELVAFETVSETPNVALQQWLADRLVERGGTAEIVTAPGGDGRANLVGRIGPDLAGGLMLAGHTDVVPPGDGWSHDPFELRIADERAFGRGAADMKGFLAAFLVATSHLDPASLTAPIRLLASYDEEIGCVGIRDVLPLLAADPMAQPDLVVVGEPTSMRPRLSHLGKQVVRVEVTSTSAHSSRAASSVSAITEAARLVAALADIQAACPPADGDAIPYSLNVGTIEGGTQTNVIAASCRFEFEVRVDADHDADAVLAPFRDAVEASRARLRVVGGEVTVEPHVGYPALRADEDAPAFAGAVRLVDGGSAVELGFGTEGGLIADALGVPVMICGPGDIAVAHRPDEFVPIPELERCVHVLRRLIDRFCCA